MSIAIAGDYASLTVSGTQYYYGYEVTDDEGDWCFQAEWPKGHVRFTQHDLELSNRWDCVNGLLRGIELLLERGYLITGEM
jgi:hypothetical protein